jgi:hypothetical protein
MNPLLQEVLESKARRRKELAALPFAEKVRIVEQMRETTRSIRASVAQYARHRPAD